MRIYIFALNEVFDTGLSTVLDTFSIANDLALAESAGTPSIHFEITVVGVRRRVHTSQGLSVPVVLAIAAVVISLGFCEPANSTTASTVTPRRSSAGRCFT
jgi:hypothetical protein